MKKPGAVFKELLRGLVTRNVMYKLSALVLSLGVWAWVQGEQVVEESAWVKVVFQPPDGLVLTEAPLTRARVTVSGAQVYTKELRRSAPSLTVDLSEFPAGAHAVDFLDFPIEDLPQGLRIVGMLPSSVELELESKDSEEVRLIPAQVGEPAEGYRVREIRIEPPVLTIEGPTSALKGLKEGLPTEGIVVTGLKGSTVREIEVPLKTTSLTRVDSTPVTAIIEIEPVVATRTFTAVPVLSRSRGWTTTQPALEVEVSVKGPIKVVEEMDGTRLTVMVLIPEGTPQRQITVGYDPRDAARFEVMGLPNGVGVEGVTPTRFTMEPLP